MVFFRPIFSRHFLHLTVPSAQNDIGCRILGADMAPRLGQALTRRIVWLGLSLLVVSVAGFAAVRIPMSQEQHAIVELGRINQSASALEVGLLNQATGQRGFDLTGSSRFLTSYRTGIAQFQRAARSLDASARRYPALRPAVSRTIRAGQAWRRLYGAPEVALRQAGGTVPPQALDQGKAHLDRFRRDAAALHRSIDTLQSHRVAQLSRYIDEVLIAAAVIIALLVAGIVAMLMRELKRWMEPLAQLTQAAAHYARGQLSEPLGVPPQSELAPLFESVEYMRQAIKKQMEHVDALAQRDPLTGLFNRRGFEENVAGMFRHRTGTPTSLVMLDIDGFKHINDQYGHQIGDDVLKAVSEILVRLCRNTDIVSRHGGEEFLVALPSTDHQAAMGQAERIRAAVEAGIRRPEPLTISLGVATCRRPESLEDAEERADQALYQAKQAGKNCVISAETAAPTPR